MGIIAMTDQTTTTPGSRAGLARSVRQGNGPSPRDLAARAAAREAAAGQRPDRAYQPRPPAAPGTEPAAPVQLTGAQALVAPLERPRGGPVFRSPRSARPP